MDISTLYPPLAGATANFQVCGYFGDLTRIAPVSQRTFLSYFVLRLITANIMSLQVMTYLGPLVRVVLSNTYLYAAVFASRFKTVK